MDTSLESLAPVISNEKENMEMIDANEEYTGVLYQFPETFINKLASINRSDIADSFKESIIELDETEFAIVKFNFGL